MSSKPDTRHRREAERGGSDFDVACAILDDTRIAHVGITMEDHPYVLPMACARDGKRLLLHGSIASRLMNSMGGNLPVCVTVTHLDGLVYARSAFHSSMNYRSVMVFGQAVEITDEQEKSAGLDRLVDHLFPGRVAEVRASTRKEINATCLLALPIETFTTKIRTGPPSDPAADLDQQVWAGVVPLESRYGNAEDAPDLKFDLAPSSSLQGLK